MSKDPAKVEAKAEAKEAKADAKFEAKIDKMVEHLEEAKNPEKALDHFEAKLEKMGVNVFIADPSVQHADPVYGTPGQHDVFIYDYAAPTIAGQGSTMGLRDFTPGEDFIVFANMKTELDLVSLGHDKGSWGAFSHSDGSTNAISMGGITYDQDVLQHTILGINDDFFKYFDAFGMG